MAKLIGAFNEIDHSRPVPASVGLIVSRKTPLLAFATERSMQLYADSLLGAYRALLDRNIAVQFIHEDRLERDGVPATIESIYWPTPSFVSDGTARALDEFVRGGGVLVAEASPGAYIEHGTFADHVPSHGLSKLFGAEVIDSDISEEIEIVLGDVRVRGAWGFDNLRVQEASVVGAFNDGSPAVVEHEYGAGRAVLIASYPSLAYERTRDVQTGTWIAGLMAGPIVPGVERLLTRTHEAGGRSLLFVLNLGDARLREAIASSSPLQLTEGLEFAGDHLVIDLPARGGALALFAAER